MTSTMLRPSSHVIARIDTARRPAGRTIQIAASSQPLLTRLAGCLARHGLPASSQTVHADPLNLPNLDGADLLVLGIEGDLRASARTIRLIRSRLGETRLVIVAARVGPHRPMGSSADSADGVVDIDRLEDALAPTAWAVLADQIVVPRPAGHVTPVLSRRERQVLALMSRGASNTLIAQRLFLSQSTVKSHLTSAFAKLGVTGRNEAAALLLDPDQAVGTLVMAVLDDHQVALGARVGP